MATYRVVVLSLLVLYAFPPTLACVDLIPYCSNLQTICIGSILDYHFTVISDLSTQVNSSSIPALESSLPLLESDLPLVLGTNDEENTSSQTTSTSSKSFDESIQNALPLLKESLPLIRESLPLIRESLPLIRTYLSPLAGKPDCQRKAMCRSCKECPKLRDSIVLFVQSLCPSTCKVCSTTGSVNSTAADLSAFFA